MQKIYVIKFNNGEYWCGMNKTSPQLRHSSMYTSLPHAKEAAESYLKKHSAESKGITSYEVIQLEITQLKMPDDLETIHPKSENKIWKIPVTWEMYGHVHVEAATIKEAIEKFKERESSSEDFPLPTDGEYVDGSFWLSDTDEENLAGVIALMNKENLEEEEK